MSKMEGVDYSGTRRILKQLNTLLLVKSEGRLNLQLIEFNEELDKTNLTYYDEIMDPKILLCLNTEIGEETHCISSIICKINDDYNSLEISSKTHPHHEGNGYNKLLRSAIILLAPYIKNNGIKIEQIVSRAINPISTLLMIKYFNALNADFEIYMVENGLERSQLILENITDFEASRFPELDEMTEEEISEFMETNEDFGEPYFISVILNPETKILANRIYDETAEKINQKITQENGIKGNKKGGSKKKKSNKLKNSKSNKSKTRKQTKQN